MAVLATGFLLTNPAVLRAAMENMVAVVAAIRVVLEVDENFILCVEGICR